MKKLISLVMSLVLLVCIFTAKSVSAYNNEEYKYELLNDGSIMITEYLGNDSEVNIPSKIDGKNVTAIEFKRQLNLMVELIRKSLKLPFRTPSQKLKAMFFPIWMITL